MGWSIEIGDVVGFYGDKWGVTELRVSGILKRATEVSSLENHGTRWTEDFRARYL